MDKKTTTLDRRQKRMLISILLILLLIVFLAGYTFAKYYEVYHINGQAEIAKWHFDVNGNTTSKTERITLTDTRNEISLDEGKIAPGTSGEFEIELDASGSEVDVKYSVSAEESGNKPQNLKFSLYKNGVTNGNKYSTIAELAEAELNGVISRNAESQIEKFVISWEWPYETGEDEEILENDNIDMEAGYGKTDTEENVFNYNFILNIVGTQAKI